MPKDKLQVGLILDEWSVEAWKYRLIECIQRSNCAEVSLVVLNDFGPRGRAPSERQTAGADAAHGSSPSFLGRFWDSAERFLVGRPGHLPNALERLDAHRLLDGTRTLTIHPTVQQSYSRVDEADLASLRNCRVDVLIRLCRQDLRGSLAQAVRHGVWSLRVGDARHAEAGVPGRMEVLGSSPVIASVLEAQIGDAEEPLVLRESYSSTNIHSLQDNASAVLWKSLHFIPRALSELHRLGEEAFWVRIMGQNPSSPVPHSERVSASTDIARVGLLWKKFMEALVRKWNARFHFDQWFLLYDLSSAVSTDFARFKYILPPKDRFWADPFVVSRDDKFYVFFEELLYAENKGRISVLEIDKDGNVGTPTTILETPYHLSYPFVFEFGNDLYMIPESKQNKTIELYKCTAFPYKWEFQKNLMAGCMATDATLLQWQGRWWMFVSQVETEGASTWDELFLYFSDNPLSTDWTPHAQNPVVSDVRSARPAGRLFEQDGRLFRPSQNSSGHYGYGFNICEIVKLTETEYEETVVEQIEPSWNTNIVSTHTFNYVDGLTIIDGQLRRRQ